MTTRDIGFVLHEEIDRREKLITQLQTECDGLKVALGVLEHPTPGSPYRVTRVVSRRGKRKPADTAPPQDTEGD